MLRNVTVLLLAATLLLPAGPAIASDLSQLRQAETNLLIRDRDRLKEQIHLVTGIGITNLSVFNQEFDRALALAGEGRPVRQLFVTAAANGCVSEECLGTVLRLMNQAMEQGYDCYRSQSAICQSIQAMARERERTQCGDDEFCQQIREEVQLRLALREDSRERSRQYDWNGEGGSGRGGGRR